MNFRLFNSIFPDLGDWNDIFSWEKNNREGVPVLGFCGPVTNMYLKPNAQYYYFTTMNEFEINQTLLVVNHNNIATPMSRDLDNHKKSTLCRVLKAYDDRYKNKVTLVGSMNSR